MSEDTGPVRPQGEIVIYQPQQGNEQIRVLLEGETVWLTQRLIAELFGVSVKTVNEHLINIYDEGELDTGSTIRKFRIVQTEGKSRVTRLLDHYSLDAILAVGYRTQSPVGTAFRQWATARLSEYLVKGFTLNDDRLKAPTASPTTSTSCLPASTRKARRKRRVSSPPPEQKAPRRHRHGGGGDRPPACGRGQGQHGLDRAETRPGDQTRRGHRQKLPRRPGD